MAKHEWTREAIIALRKDLGLTQLELAIQLHVTQETVSRWERGKFTPSFHVARELDRLAKKRGASGP